MFDVQIFSLIFVAKSFLALMPVFDSDNSKNLFCFDYVYLLFCFFCFVLFSLLLLFSANEEPTSPVAPHASRSEVLLLLLFSFFFFFFSFILVCGCSSVERATKCKSGITTTK
jgi:hypothetical membrane protein